MVDLLRLSNYKKRNIMAKQEKKDSKQVLYIFFVIIMVMFINTIYAQVFHVVDFETGDFSQVTSVYPHSRSEIVPSDLPGGGKYMAKFTMAEGKNTYCGFDQYLPKPMNEYYLRYHIKFDSNWLFASNNIWFKSVIFEVVGQVNGRGFLNMNTIPGSGDTLANLQWLSYPNDTWYDTGVDIGINRWYCIEVYRKTNASNPAQGAIRVWVDGNLVLNEDPYNGGTGEAFLNPIGYRNGVTQHQMSVYYDELVWSTTYIGPLLETSSLLSVP